MHHDYTREIQRSHITDQPLAHDEEDIRQHTDIYSNKKETSDFHGTVSFDPVKISQQK